MIETSSLGGGKKLLIEHHKEYMEFLHNNPNRIAYSGTQTINHTTYFYVVLK